jgi:hypothetical protein
MITRAAVVCAGSSDFRDQHDGRLHFDGVFVYGH